MKTYQDLEKIGDNDKNRMDFILSAINEHKSSEMYGIAFDAEEYSKQRNITIMNYVKVLYTLEGKAVPDLYSPNHKIASNFFKRFTMQENQYLLGNGVRLDNDDNKKKLGKNFDYQLQKMGRDALVEGVSFGFWNNDHLDTFKLTEFVPLWDEEEGTLKAGIRFFQIDADKPLRVTLYEPDGYTNFEKKKNEDMTILEPGKQAYKGIVQKSVVDGEELIAGENYDGFPIIPMYGNEDRQSELVGMRDSIDAYDLIKSGFSNDMDGAQVYWLLKNSGGMDDVDMTKFLERLHIVGAASVDEADEIKPYEVPIPYESRVAYLEKLEEDMYADYQALNVSSISSGNKTATEIRAAYQPFDNKVDGFEYCVLDFLDQLFAIVGIENENPTFTRNKVACENEDMQTLMMAADYLDDDYLTEKSCAIIGDPDAAEENKQKRQDADVDRLLNTDTDNGGGQVEVQGKTLNGAQTQSLLSIMAQFSAGSLTEGQAVKLISTSIGISTAEARAILNGELDE